MSSPSDHAISFEGVKVAMRQTKDGYALTLLVHPEDAPTTLFHGKVGQRYMVALVAIGDQEEPIPTSVEEGVDNQKQDRVFYAFRLCREPLFWEYLRNISDPLVDVRDEASAVVEMRAIIGVDSRRELAVPGPHVDKFEELCSGYRAWAGITKDLR